MDYSLPGFSIHGDSLGRNIGVDLPNPGIKVGSPARQVDSLPAELPGKPRRYGTI